MRLHDDHPWSHAGGAAPAEPRLYNPADAIAFKLGMRQLAAAVTVVTTGGPAGERAGLTATAVCSVSSEPPQLLVCINSAAGTHAAIKKHGNFCVNVLASKQLPIAKRFAGHEGGTRAERFDLGDWGQLATGAPVLRGCLVNFDCTLTQESVAGTHSIFLGSVAAVSITRGLEPLAFVDGQFLTLSKARRSVDAALWDWS
jgi:flavin reductase (DIM6/NTAB) family NADH-FMN oxidoreductase RutF